MVLAVGVKVKQGTQRSVVSQRKVISHLGQRRIGQRHVRATKEIAYYQRNTALLILRVPFARLTREILDDCASAAGIEGIRITSQGLYCLQSAMEAFLAHWLGEAYLLSIHAKRITLMPRDLTLASRILQIAHPDQATSEPHPSNPQTVQDSWPAYPLMSRARAADTELNMQHVQETGQELTLQLQAGEALLTPRERKRLGNSEMPSIHVSHAFQQLVENFETPVPDNSIIEEVLTHWVSLPPDLQERVLDTALQTGIRPNQEDLFHVDQSHLLELAQSQQLSNFAMIVGESVDALMRRTAAARSSTESELAPVFQMSIICSLMW